MKKKFIVALATSLILANGASTAFADNGSGSDSDKSTHSVSNDDSRDNFRMTDAQKDAFKAQRAAYKTEREVIMATFHTAMENARDTFKAAREAATTDEARTAAREAFKTAVRTATQVKTDALKALGAKPEKPALTPEQTAAIERFRQAMITYKADLAIFKEKVEAIRKAYQEALKALGEPPVKPEEPNSNS